MPFGLRNASLMFQSVGYHIKRSTRENLRFYLDYVLMLSPSASQDVFAVEEILYLLQDAGVTVILKKYPFSEGWWITWDKPFCRGSWNSRRPREKKSQKLYSRRTGSG